MARTILTLSLLVLGVGTGLAVSGCATRPVPTRAPADSWAVVYTSNGEPEYITLVSDDGHVVVLDADDCDTDCISRLKKLVDAKRYDTVGLRDEKPSGKETLWNLPAQSAVR